MRGAHGNMPGAGTRQKMRYPTSGSLLPAGKVGDDGGQGGVHADALSL